MSDSMDLKTMAYILIGIIVIIVVIGAIYLLYTNWGSIQSCISSPLSCITGSNSSLADQSGLPNVSALTSAVGLPNVLNVPADVTAVKTAVDAVPLSCPSGYSETASLCYPNCPTGMKSSGLYCLHDRKLTGAGKPMTCPITDPKTKTPVISNAGLCYTVPDYNWEVTSPGVIGLKCPTTATVTLTDGVDKKTVKILDSGTTCWYDRGAGTVPPLTCPANTINRGSVCYDPPPAGNVFTLATGGTYGKDCPAGSNASAMYCTQDRGVGTPLPCHSGGKLDKDGVYRPSSDAGLCYPAPLAGFSCAGPTCNISRNVGSSAAHVLQQNCGSQILDAGLCYDPPAAGFKCVGTNCSTSKNILFKAGVPISACPSGDPPNAGLCYPKCPPQYSRKAYDIEACNLDCPSGTTDMGIIGCQKNARPLIGSNGVGTCDSTSTHPFKIGDLCYTKANALG